MPVTTASEQHLRGLKKGALGAVMTERQSVGKRVLDDI